jgi:hypothetical protein
LDDGDFNLACGGDGGARHCRRHRVIGVLAAKGQSGWGQDQDDLVMIPFATAESKILGVAAPSQTQAANNPLFPAPTNPFGMQPRLTGKVNAIYVQARGSGLVPEAVQQVTDTRQTRHHIQPGTVNDFDVRDLSQIAQARESSSRIMALLLLLSRAQGGAPRPDRGAPVRVASGPKGTSACIHGSRHPRDLKTWPRGSGRHRGGWAVLGSVPAS